MKWRGRVSSIMCSRSSWLAWPDTWTKATSSHRTSAPRLSRALMARPITRSLPGITRGKDHEIPWSHLHVLVLARRDEGDGGVRLALAPRGENHLPRRRQGAQILEGDE